MREVEIPIQKLLLVEDDELYRHTLARAFQRRGVEVFEADTIKNALYAAASFKPDSALVDLRLGSESGLDALRALLSEHPALRVVLLTAYGTIVSALEAVKLGAVNYLTKPIDFEHIISAFEKIDSPSRRPLTAIPSAEQVEWDYINRTVRDFGGNVSRAAKALGLHRRSLQRKLQKPPPMK